MDKDDNDKERLASLERRIETIESSFTKLPENAKPTKFQRVEIKVTPTFPIHDVAFSEDLVIRILAYLSRKEYLTCKLVCKRWDALQHNVAIMRKALFSRKVTRSKIRSVSSGNFLDGRSIEVVSSGGKIFLSPPRSRNPEFFDWDLIEIEDGIYNIKSATSNAFIDGRHKGIGNGVHTKLNNRIDDSSASQNNYYKWRVKKHQNGCVSIQSVSSGLYLDGRSREYVGDQLFLTGRNPEGDNFLMWEIGFEN